MILYDDFGIVFRAEGDFAALFARKTIPTRLTFGI